jgi:diguanylate cyclase (GGDEF)-like protein
MERGGSAPERMLRSLLELRGCADTQRAVLTGIGDCLHASWVAYFAAEGGEIVCKECDGSGPAPGTPLPSALALRSLRPGGILLPISGDPAEALGAKLAAALDLGIESRAMLLVGPSRSGAGYDGEKQKELERLSEASAVAIRNAVLFERLRSQASFDFLTECYNRRGFEEHLRVEMVRARRYRRPMSLLLVDLDNFKVINDALGHPAGDHALRRLGSLLLGAFRTTDVVCRYGGDEFAVIFPETSKDDAVRLATRLRAKVESIFPDEIIPQSVTASFGVGSYPRDGQETDELVRAADHALYRAKSEGRNRVVAA